LAVKIIRQHRKVVLLGSATSAAALRAGHERAPEALRAAGLADRLKTAGFEVADLGDTATYSRMTSTHGPGTFPRFSSPSMI
jgi:arginase family enzyme